MSKVHYPIYELLLIATSYGGRCGEEGDNGPRGSRLPCCTVRFERLGSDVPVLDVLSIGRPYPLHPIVTVRPIKWGI